MAHLSRSYYREKLRLADLVEVAVWGDKDGRRVWRDLHRKLGGL